MAFNSALRGSLDDYRRVLRCVIRRRTECALPELLSHSMRANMRPFGASVKCELRMGLQDPQSYSTPVDDVRAELQALELVVERLRRVTAASRAAVPRQIAPGTLRLIIKARRTRELVLDPKLFADPAWDILLEAYVADLMQTRLSITSLCFGTGVSMTTALRWLRKLEEKGWLERKADLLSARRTCIELTGKGSARMSQYFDTIPPSVLPI